jgi:transposase
MVPAIERDRADEKAKRAAWTGVHACDLPPYSPNFNPIEMMWFKLQAILRKIKVRTVDTLRLTLFHALFMLFL